MATTTTELDSTYPLSSQLVASFEENGFVKLPGALSPETIAAYEPEITSKVIELNTQQLPLDERDTYGKAFLQVINLWEHSQRVKELVYSTRLARMATELLGVDGVRIYHDQALYKEEGGGITPWHADQYYWPLDTDRCVTVWIPLQPTPLNMGPLSFAAGSHRFSYGRDLEISDESERRMQQALAEQDFPIVESPYELGDVSFHLGWTFHRASPNRTTIPRRVMTVIYMDADIHVAEPVNTNQRGAIDGHLGGTRVGEIPDTPRNPVLYRRGW